MKKVLGKTSGISGRGGYAGERIKKGETILLMQGKKVTSEEADELLEAGLIRQDDPFQMSDMDYVILEGVSYLLNHSCEPNAGIRGERELVALRDIKKGEEIAYDYSTTVGEDAPHEGSWHMKCACGAKACRKRIGNWETLSSERLAFYMRERALPDYIIAQLAKRAVRKGKK